MSGQRHAEAWLGEVVTRWVEACLERPRSVVTAVIVATLAALPFLPGRLGINSDTTRMIDPTIPWQAEFHRLNALFPFVDDLLVAVIDAPSPAAADQAATALADALAGHPAVAGIHDPAGGSFIHRNGLLMQDVETLERRLDDLSAFQPFLGRASDPVGLLDLVGRALQGKGNGPAARELRDEVASVLEASADGGERPLRWSALDPDGGQSRRLLLITAHQDFRAWRPGMAAMEAVREAGRRLDLAHRSVNLRLTGPVALQTEELDTVSRGALQGGAAALVMVALLLYWGLRSLRMVAVTLVTLLVGLILTATFAAFAVGHLNLISIAFAVLYIGLGIDFAIHYGLRFRELLPVSEDVRTAVLAAAQDVGASLALCALTTSTGFLAFVPTAFSGVSELGLIAGAGMFISLVVTVTLLPCLLVLLPRPQHLDTRSGGRRTRALGQWVNRHAGAVILGSMAIGLLSLPFLPRVQFDANPVNLRPADAESVRTHRDLLDRPETSPMALTVIVADDQAATMRRDLQALRPVHAVNGLHRYLPPNQEDRLALIEEMAWLVPPTSPAVPIDTETLRTALKDLSTATRDDPRLARAAADAAESLDPPRATGLARSLTVELRWQLERLNEAMAVESLTRADLPDDLLRRWLSADGRWQRLVILPQAEDSKNEHVGAFVDAVRRSAPRVTGIPVVNELGGQVVVGAFVQAFLTAGVAIVVLLVVLLRRPLDVGLVMLPLLLASPIIAALSVLSGVSFNFANVITLPLLLGIGVDNGIHMVHRVRHAPPDDGNLLASSTARAVLFSAATTVAGFGNLALSPHPGTASMGMLLSAGMGVYLLGTLLTLPALIRRCIPCEPATAPPDD